jgi:intein/homing endonuclease
MNVNQKKEEIERVKLRLKNEMPRILKEIAVYEKALKDGTLIKNLKPGPQYNL